MAYDQASILMNGKNAKTNFPTSKNQEANTKPSDDPSSLPSKAFSELLSTKLRRCCKDPSPSLTCLRLDADNAHIGVWQKRAGPRSGSNWVMRVELRKKEARGLDEELSPSPGGTPSFQAGSGMNEEDRIAMQMIEELLNWNHPTTSSTIADQGDDKILPPLGP